MTLNDARGILRKAKSVTIDGHPGIHACCPAPGHQDKHPSFDIYEKGDGFLHVKCWSRGCSEDDILSGLGWSQDDRRIEERVQAKPSGRPPKPPEIVYNYLDAHGKIAYRKKRYYLWDDVLGWVKKFIFQHDENGQWVIGQGESPALLYNLPAVIAAVAAKETIYLNEGEKAADCFMKKGLVGTCQPYGANSENDTSIKWEEEYTRILRGAKVVAIADRDKSGSTFGRLVYDILADDCDVTVVTSATAGLKHDGYDHLMAGFEVDEFVPAPQCMVSNLPAITTLNGVFKPAPLSYLLEPYLPLGKPVLLDGTGGVGKSTLALAFAAGFSVGRTPMSSENCESCETLYLHAGEDDNEELETVYRSMGGACGSLHYYNTQEDAPISFNYEGLRILKRLIRAHNCKFLVVDSLFYFLTGVIKNPNDPMEVQIGIKPFRKMIASANIGCLVLRHTKKGNKDTDAADMGLGSVQFKNAFRGQLLARWHPAKKGVVVVTDEKGTLLNRRGDAFCYVRRGEYGAVEYLVNEPNPFSSDEDEETKLLKIDQAKILIRNRCTGHLVLSSEIFDILADAGISKRTGETLMKELGVQSRKSGPEGSWYKTIRAPAFTLDETEPDNYDAWNDV